MTGHDRLQPIYGRISPYFRKKRVARFLRWLAPGRGETILDVGGYPLNWQHVAIESEIVTLNLEVVEGSERIDPRCKPVLGDGTALPYPDDTFDIVFSNSVIEHVGTWERQQQFAREARRVGRKLWVQTPARIFPIEPHYLAPFIHWLPCAVRKRLIRNFTPLGWLQRPRKEEVERLVDEIRLLSKSELQMLFPDCTIIVERCLGWPKSYVAMRS
jgi:hypothetical protein